MVNTLCYVIRGFVYMMTPRQKGLSLPVFRTTFFVKRVILA